MSGIFSPLDGDQGRLSPSPGPPPLFFFQMPWDNPPPSRKGQGRLLWWTRTALSCLSHPRCAGQDSGALPSSFGSAPLCLASSLHFTCTHHQAQGPARPQCPLLWTKCSQGIGKGVWGCVAEQSVPHPHISGVRGAGSCSGSCGFRTARNEQVDSGP